MSKSRQSVLRRAYALGQRLRFRHDIFLSYARGDGRDYAEALKRQLEKLDFTCFFDAHDLPAVITKTDLAEACDFDRAAALHNIETVRPGMRVFEVSAKRGDGMGGWVGWVAGRE